MFSGPSTYADSVDTAMLFIVGVSVLLLAGITFAMIYFVFKYNRKRHPVAKQIHGHIGLEILWIALPTILVLFMFWYGYTDYKDLRATADGALVVDVTAKMWEWDFKYKNGKESDTLYIPLNRTTRLDMRSLDVNHSFYVPAFRLKEDVIASRTTFLVLEPTKTGSFDIACAEYCGLKHAYMYTKLKVVPGDEFDEWYNKVEEIAADSLKLTGDSVDVDSEEMQDSTVVAEAPLSDFDVLQKRGCIVCHSTDGSVKLGPSFKDLADDERIVVAGSREKEVEIDDEYLRKSILDPNSEVVKGFKKYVMPDQSKLISEEELESMIRALNEFKNSGN